MHWKKVRDTAATCALVFVFSFLLNYTWESLHAVFLYEGHNFQAEKYIRMLLYVAAVDGLIISVIYLGVAALWRDILWLREMNRKQIFTACIAGAVIAAVIEYRKVLILKVWSYTPLMPTIFGIGVSPVLQLGVTVYLTFWLSRRVLFGKRDL